MNVNTNVATISMFELADVLDKDHDQAYQIVKRFLDKHGFDLSDYERQVKIPEGYQPEGKIVFTLEIPTAMAVLAVGDEVQRLNKVIARMDEVIQTLL